MTDGTSGADSPAPQAPGMTSATVTRVRLPIALLPLAITYLAVALNMTIASVALPTISIEFHATGAQLAWIVNATPLAAASLILFAGSWADHFGQKRLLLAGLTIFLIAAGLSALAQNVQQLIALRALTGVGSAMAMPTALALTFAVTAKSARRTAIGIMAATQAVGSILGPLVGGLALVNFGWSAAFVAVTPFLVVALILNLLLLPSDAQRTGEATSAKPAMDTRGATFVALISVSLLYAAASVANLTAGWDEVAALACAVVSFVALVRWERRAPNPLFVGDILRRTTYWLPTLVVFSTQLVLGGLLFLNTQYVQLVLGYSAFGAGLFLTPALLVWVIAAGTSGLSARALGVRGVSTSALMIAAVALFSIGISGEDPHVAVLLIGLALVGVLGAVPALMTHMAVDSYPAERRTVGSAINSVSLRMGMAFGIAVFGSIFTLTYGSIMAPIAAALPAADQNAVTNSLGGALRVAGGLTEPASAILIDASQDAFVEGFHRALFTGSVLLLVLALLTFLLLRSGSPRDTEDTTESTDDLEQS